MIETKGTFGPWKKGDPGGTPLAGTYSFQKADLGTIKGIGGILEFDRRVRRRARADCRQGPDTRPGFHVDVSGHPVVLDTTFEAVVDGTDGDTYLNVVNAKFLQTALTAKGAVTGTKGVKGQQGQADRPRSGRPDRGPAPARDERRQPLLVGKVALHTGL